MLHKLWCKSMEYDTITKKNKVTLNFWYFPSLPEIPYSHRYPPGSCLNDTLSESPLPSHTQTPRHCLLPSPYCFILAHLTHSTCVFTVYPSRGHRLCVVHCCEPQCLQQHRHWIEHSSNPGWMHGEWMDGWIWKNIKDTNVITTYLSHVF